MEDVSAPILKQSSRRYSLRISEAVLYGIGAFTIDFEDVVHHDLSLAESLIQKPDETLKHARDECVQPEAN